MNEEFIDLEAVVERLGCNIATLYKAIDEGHLTAVKGIGRGYRTTWAWVQAWIERKTVNPEAAAPSGK